MSGVPFTLPPIEEHEAFYFDEFLMELPETANIQPSPLPSVARGRCWFGAPELLPDPENSDMHTLLGIPGADREMSREKIVEKTSMLELFGKPPLTPLAPEDEECERFGFGLMEDEDAGLIFSGRFQAGEMLVVGTTQPDALRAVMESSIVLHTALKNSDFGPNLVAHTAEKYVAYDAKKWHRLNPVRWNFEIICAENKAELQSKALPLTARLSGARSAWALGIESGDDFVISDILVLKNKGQGGVHQPQAVFCVPIDEICGSCAAPLSMIFFWC